MIIIQFFKGRCNNMLKIHTAIDKNRSYKELRIDYINNAKIIDNACIYGTVYAFEKINGKHQRINHDVYSDFILTIRRDYILLSLYRNDENVDAFKAKLIPCKEYCFKVNKKSISSCYLTDYHFDDLIELFTDDLWECYRNTYFENIINTSYFKVH